MLQSFYTFVLPLPTEIPSLLQFTWTVRLEKPELNLQQNQKELFISISCFSWPLDSAIHTAFSTQGWIRAPLLTKPKEKWDHGWDAWKQEGEKCPERAVGREEKAMSVVGGCYNCSFIPSAAQSWSLQSIHREVFTAQK